MKYLKISKNEKGVQYLTDILPVIETNTILDKTITGIGATYSEIKAPRNSIIVEPTKPVIYGKCKDEKHKVDNLFGVYQGVYKDDITDYIEKSIRKKKFIKILTTPESFRKVQDAFEELDIDIRFDGYFLLFDECQKMVKDCDYRQDITLPMDLFFECREKAMVSATPPTEFSDPRFKDFCIVKISPDFDYRKELNLHTTNNVLQYTRELLKSLKDDDCPMFLFVNSTDMIFSLMRQLDVVGQSAVFCSEKSVTKLKQLEFKKAYEFWDEKKMARYNWMTSRFYSALDIELETQPNVVMLTECYVAEYTMIDPYMDAVQILGRFRNGINQAFHISNYDLRIPIKSKEQIVDRYQCEHEAYMSIKTMIESVSVSEQKEAYSEWLAVCPYNKFLDREGKEDCFRVDNYIDEEVVKTFYSSDLKLREAYVACEYFDVNHIGHPYRFGDYERLKIANQNISIKEKRKIIVAQLEQLGDCVTEAECQYKRDLQFADPLIVEAYDVLGKKCIEQLKYCVTRIKEAIIVKKHQEKAYSTDVIKLINASFYPQQWYSAKYIKQRLTEIMKMLNVSHTKAITSHTINEYFYAQEIRKHEGRGYFLIEPKFKVT
ncbi:MAG: DEAD/DEAH box helicase family protein [Bacteroidaceae bacterium]|nr:DEAD/DEAH box helicase family protein [Bacteroidaceae bacterium]